MSHEPNYRDNKNPYVKEPKPLEPGNPPPNATGFYNGYLEWLRVLGADHLLCAEFNSHDPDTQSNPYIRELQQQAQLQHEVQQSMERNATPGRGPKAYRTPNAGEHTPGRTPFQTPSARGNNGRRNFGTPRPQNQARRFTPTPATRTPDQRATPRSTPGAGTGAWTSGYGSAMVQIGYFPTYINPLHAYNRNVARHEGETMRQLRLTVWAAMRRLLVHHGHLLNGVLPGDLHELGNKIKILCTGGDT